MKVFVHFFTSQANAYPNRESHRKHAKNVVMMYSLGDRHNHEKKLFCAKKCEKKVTNILLSLDLCKSG